MKKIKQKLVHSSEQWLHWYKTQLRTAGKRVLWLLLWKTVKYRENRSNEKFQLEFKLHSQLMKSPIETWRNKQRKIRKTLARKQIDCGRERSVWKSNKSDGGNVAAVVNKPRRKFASEKPKQTRTWTRQWTAKKTVAKEKSDLRGWKLFVWRSHETGLMPRTSAKMRVKFFLFSFYF